MELRALRGGEFFVVDVLYLKYNVRDAAAECWVPRGDSLLSFFVTPTCVVCAN
jgi:hypothetical protein